MMIHTGYCGFRIILFLNGVTGYNDFFKWLQRIFPVLSYISLVHHITNGEKKSKANDDDETETAA